MESLRNRDEERYAELQQWRSLMRNNAPSLRSGKERYAQWQSRETVIRSILALMRNNAPNWTLLKERYAQPQSPPSIMRNSTPKSVFHRERSGTIRPNSDLERNDKESAHGRPWTKERCAVIRRLRPVRRNNRKQRAQPQTSEETMRNDSSRKEQWAIIRRLEPSRRNNTPKSGLEKL